jgi:hypothetical protein
MSDPIGETISHLVARLAALPASERLFNPYAPLDDPAASIRRANLIRYLTDMSRLRPDVLLLAEAPGYRGCALSGIPITSERIMLCGVEKWGLFGDGYRPTSGHPQGVAEMTASILWRALIEHAERPPVLWNTVPLHPHQPGDLLSNRTPSVEEQHMGTAFIEDMLNLYKVERILAVGRTAQHALDRLGYAYIPLRHPAQGGKAEFVEGLRAALA